MTPEQHNKYLSWAHFIHASLTALMFGLAAIFMTFVISVEPNPPPWPFLVFMWLFLGVFLGIIAAPSFIAGYGLRKRRSWAKTASIIAGVTASMSAPVGVGVCIYTFWFLFSEPGKLLYDRSYRALPHGQAAWNIPAREVKEQQYVPPPSPPDWR